MCCRFLKNAIALLSFHDMFHRYEVSSQIESSILPSLENNLTQKYLLVNHKCLLFWKHSQILRWLFNLLIPFHQFVDIGDSLYDLNNIC